MPASLPDITMEDLAIIVDFAPQMGWKWYFLAYALGVEYLVMELAPKPLFADSKCLIVLQDWINQGGQDVTWQKLLDVLWALQLRSVALALCDKLMG